MYICKFNIFLIVPRKEYDFVLYKKYIMLLVSVIVVQRKPWEEIYIKKCFPTLYFRLNLYF